MAIKEVFDGRFIMNENMIYKMVFEEVNESREWSCDCNDSNYSWYIDGVISLAKRMLDKVNEPKNCEDTN